MSRAHKIGIFICILLILIVPVLAIDPTSNPSPIIHVDYSPDDAPITIQQATITFPSGFILNLNGGTDNGYQYYFPSNTYLFPGTYALSIVAHDSDSNIITVEDSFEILQPESNIWITNPPIYYFPNEQQSIGMGDNLPFTLTAKTKVPAICRLRRFFPPIPNDPEELFMGAGFVYFNNDDGIQTTTHSVTVTDLTSANPPFELPLSSPFNYNDPESGAYLIVCKQESQDGDVGYFIDQFHFGYDPTDPVYTVSFDPNPIIDEYAVETSMNVESEEDFLACEYNHVSNPSPGQSDSQGEEPIFNTIQDIYFYSQTPQHIFDFPGKTFSLNQPYIYSVEVDCHNPAMRHTIQTIDYVVELTRDLDVTLEEDYYLSSNPTLNFTSTLHAVCQYTFGDESDYIDGTSPKTEHLLTLSGLNDGLHAVDLHCETVGVGGEFDETFFFTVDTQAPTKPNITGRTLSCGEDNIEITITPNNEGLQRYNISLLLGSQTISQTMYPQGYTSDPISYSLPVAPLIENETYTWVVYAEDEGGLTSPVATQDITITKFESVMCDETPPTAWIETDVTTSGFEVEIHCQDGESGCADYFSYNTIGVDEECTFPISGQTQYSTLPLFFSEDEKICYQVFDNAGNFANEQSLISASFDITLLSPKFGMADSKAFPFQIETKRNSVCKHGYNAVAHPDQISDWYLTLDDFDTSGGTIHTFAFDSVNYLQLDETQAKDITKWVVICNELGAYSLLEIDPFGFDTTPPNIFVQATPNPVIDPGNMVTNLTVMVDDNAVCTYLDSDGIATGFPGYDPENPNSYKKTHSVEISYWGVQELFNDNQIIKCRNLAQNYGEEPYVIEVAPEDKVQITINNEEYSAEKNIDLNVTTGQLAECSFRVDEDDDFVQMQQTGNYNHINSVVLEEGETTFEVFCVASGSGDEGLKAKTITLDTISPIVEILTTDDSCSLEGITFSVAATENGSGIDYIEYEITGPNSEVIASDTTQDLDIYETLDLEDGESYTIDVTAYDMVGNQGSTSKIITASEYDAVACDTIPPKASIQTSPTWGGYNATISCTDNVGCSDQFTYLIGDEFCSGSQSSKLYDSQPTLIDTTTTLCYTVFDGAGNSDEGQYSFTVLEQCYNGIEDPDEEDVDCGGVCAEVNPCDGGLRKLDLVSPQFGIASTKNFNLEVKTNAEATCRQGYLADAHPDDVSDWYLSLDDFLSTGLTTHSTPISASSYLQLNENLEKDTTEWVVICKQFEVYKVLEIDPFGFDITVPAITIDAKPNPVIDPGNMATKLTVTTDDNTVCTYLNQEGTPTGFSDYDPDNFNSYKKTHTTTISYWAIKEPFEDIQEIKCRNLAQLFSDKSYTINVEPEDKVQITINNDEFTNKENVVLNVSTGQKAYCKYRMDDPKSPFIDMQHSGEYLHTQAVSLTEGPHDFEVFCTARGTGDEGLKAKTITLDTINPEITILSTEKSCSLESYSFTLLAGDDGSGIDYFDYEIIGPNGTLVTDTTSNSEVYEELELEDGKSYQIKVTGYDKAGNSGETEKTIIASVFDPLNCDVISPEAKIKTSAIWEGFHATVSCEDDVECSDKFTYVFEDEDCNLTQTAEDYKNQPFTVTKDTKLCVTVFDLAGNKDETEKSFMIAEQCFNEIEDPDEGGVDCGGPCLAECGTCDNGKQDVFELGIDCGGLCESIRSCETGLKTNNPDDVISENNSADDKECSTTADCQPGYICNYNYECEPDLNNSPPVYTEDKGMNIWGLILIILGILLMGGGSYYISDSRTKKAQEEKIKSQRMQQQSSMHAQQAAVQKVAEAKRLESLKQKHLQQKENLNKHVEERKEKRKSLLGVFEVSDNKEKQNEEKKSEITTENTGISKPSKPKEDSKLDEGFTEEFIDVRKLHKNPLTDLERLKLKQDEEKKQAEELKTKSLTEEKEKSSTEKSEEKLMTADDKKTNIFSELKSLAKKEHVKKPIVNDSKPIIQTEIKEVEKTTESKDKEKQIEEPKSSNSFAALQNMVSHSESPGNKKLNKELLRNKKVSSDELMNIFTKDVDSFDENTLLSVLSILIEEQKIDMTTSRNVLEKLAEKGLINKQKINILFSKLVKGK